jgi:hypothetical protein
MSKYCTCTVEIISKSGFSIREGVAYCNSCLKPEVNSAPADAAIKNSNSNPIIDLYDFKFERFVSISYFRLLYGITVVLWSIIAVVFLFLVLMNASYINGGIVFLLLIGIPIGYLLLLIYTRMSIELIINFFEIGKDIKSLKEL